MIVNGQLGNVGTLVGIDQVLEDLMPCRVAQCPGLLLEGWHSTPASSCSMARPTRAEPETTLVSDRKLSGRSADDVDQIIARGSRSSRRPMARKTPCRK